MRLRSTTEGSSARQMVRPAATATPVGRPRAAFLTAPSDRQNELTVEQERVGLAPGVGGSRGPAIRTGRDTVQVEDE
jgi:hypothetical protein